MKPLKQILSSTSVALVVLIAVSAPASAQKLLEKKFSASAESEALLDLTASAAGASWVTAGAEAATVMIFVDGRHHQDVILFAGSKEFTYKLLLGRVAAGEHGLRIELDRAQSAPQCKSVNITDAKITLLDRNHADFRMIANAPILFARPNTIGKFSDVPLLMYCETLKTLSTESLTTLRYTVIFSNEDGGTQTAALMARWGRTTDIEWVVDVQLDAEGRVVTSTFQGVNHETKTFQGKHEAGHPLFLTKSDNNNFADDGDSPMRFALRPIAVDLSRHSREWVMDQHPWTYTVMAEEMIREGKITAERSLGVRIGDLRDYLYVDAASDQQNGALISFAVKLKGGKWYASDLGINYYKIDRSGYFRTTIRLPKGTTLDEVERLVVRCDLAGNPRSKEEIGKAVAATCDLKAVNTVFLLDHKPKPGPSLPVRSTPMRLRFGEMAEIEIGRDGKK